MLLAQALACRAVALTLLGASAWRGGHPTGLRISSGLVHGRRCRLGRRGAKLRRRAGITLNLGRRGGDGRLIGCLVRGRSHLGIGPFQLLDPPIERFQVQEVVARGIGRDRTAVQGGLFRLGMAFGDRLADDRRVPLRQKTTQPVAEFV